MDTGGTFKLYKQMFLHVLIITSYAATEEGPCCVTITSYAATEEGPCCVKKMDHRQVLLLELAVLQYQLQLMNVRIGLIRYNRARRREGARQRRWACRGWLSPRRRHRYGLYHRLMQELRAEDPYRVRLYRLAIHRHRKSNWSRIWS